MSNKVRVPYGESASDTATLLLAAAEEKDQDASVVTVSSLGGFVVPEDIAKAAGLDYEDPEGADGSRYSEAQVEEAAETPLKGSDGPIEIEEPKAAAKKAPAKKAAAKKTAKKSTAKKGS